MSSLHSRLRQGSAPTVLVVEDEVLIRLDTAESLRSLGFRVVEAADAEETLALFRGGLKVAAVFSDIRLPGKTDGVALARLLRQRVPEMKIVMTSGLVSSDAAREIADAFVDKPYDCRDIAGILERLIGAPHENTGEVAA
jgi:two-component system, response regulator PdtaR